MFDKINKDTDNSAINKSSYNQDLNLNEVKPNINADYGNEFHFLGVAFRYGGFSAVKDLLNKSGIYKNQPDFHMQTYEERSEKYGYDLSDKNKEKIRKIDELSSQMNKLVENVETMDEESFRKIYDELDSILYGYIQSNLPKKN